MRDMDDMCRGRVAHVAHDDAKIYRIRYRRGAIENWGEAVTRAAGDDVKTDKTRGLLIRLKQRNVLNAAQFTRLIVNHLREQPHV